MSKILIGPAGSGGAELKNFEAIKKLGLDAVELEFVHSIWLSKEQALKIAELNKTLNLRLSIHAPYYINLNSEEKSKIHASIYRILKCCEIGHYLSEGSKNKTNIVFHPGFYLKKTKQEAYDIIKKSILEIQEKIKEKNYRINLCPETTGKPTQFGDLDELIQLIKDTGCSICVDFSHLKARYNGIINYDEIMAKLKNISPVHCHFSGIEFGEKGEKRHLITQEKDIKELFSFLNKYNIDATIINESPDTLGDSLKMKKLSK